MPSQAWSPTGSASSHRPRKKNAPSKLLTVPEGAVSTDPKTSVRRPTFPLASLLWPATGTTSSWTLLPLVLMVAGLFRCAIGLWPYSGYRSPPMHGDFEAQRHWLEITIHLPISQWYFYDLQWWGLDYPPLTAYHSWLCGKIGYIIEPSWFELDASRGLDDLYLKLFMRATVIGSEYILYLPAVILLFRRFSRIQGTSGWQSILALVAVSLQPSVLLIDHAHFQYNTVMLGFVVASLYSIVANRTLWGCVFFVAALGFKQMALYYAPAMFAYLLGSCIFPKPNISRFLSIATVTTISFAILYAPLIAGALYDGYRGIRTLSEEPPLFSYLPVVLKNPSSPIFLPLLVVAQSIHRIFPFARGLFEDKVANVWCALHTVHKLNQYSPSLLQRTSLIATLVAIIPACTMAFLRPTPRVLLPALASTAWAFFLFSFQVHEKSVLLPLMPMTLLLGTLEGLTPGVRSWVGWANNLGVFTMFPLLKRDGLRVPYIVLSLLWAYLLGLPPSSLDVYSSSYGALAVPLWTRMLHQSLYLMMMVWHLIEAYIPPPAEKKDLWVVANVGIGVVGFGICYLWCLWKTYKASGLQVISSEAKEKSHDHISLEVQHRKTKT